MRIEVGPFFLEEPIGKGGMGEVWRGQHSGQGVPVAVKVMTQDGARKPLYIKSFHNEVAAICRLHHEGIIRVFDYGVISELASQRSQGRLVTGSPYLVMELAKLGSLEHFTDVLDWPSLRAVLLSTLEALAHAHARGIVHRDLKPQNILIGCSGSRRVKLSDFGLAHAVAVRSQGEEGDDDMNAGWGTPAYMAPEQFRGSWRDYGPWTDLYALGCMAFELCTSSVPFFAKDRWEFGRLHMLEQVPRMMPSFPVPAGFEAWVLRLMQKLPGDRFQRAADAMLALLSLSDPDEDAHTDYLGDSREMGRLIIPNKSQALAYMTQNVSPEQMSLHLSQDRLHGSVSQPTSEGFHRRRASLAMTREPSAPPEDEQKLHLTPSSPADIDDLDRGHAPVSSHNMPVSPFPINLPPMPLSWMRPDESTSKAPLHGAGMGLFGLNDPELVGREVERDLLWQTLREVHASGQPHAVMLRGASGVGKSMIAKWFLTRAHELGVADMMRATHSPRRSAFDGLSAMLARYLRVQGSEPEERLQRIRTHLGARWCMEYGLVDALNEFIDPAAHQETQETAGVMLSSHPARQRLHTLRAFMEYETRDRPLIVFLEDVQWAPEALVMVQNVLTRRMALSQALPVLFVMTLREDALDPAVLESLLVQQLTGLGACYEHSVPAMSDDAATSLVRSLLHLDPTLEREIVKRSHGVPLFAVQLLGELVNGHRLALEDQGFSLREGDELELPDDIHDLWQQRVDRCVMRYPGSHAVALELASALGQEFSFKEWFEVSGLMSHELGLDFVEGLENDGLLSVEQDRVSFSHNMLRESLERGSREAGRWARLNSLVVDYLQLSSASRSADKLARIAEHLILAGREEEALTPLVQAARDVVLQGQLEYAEHLIQMHEFIIVTHDIQAHQSVLEQKTLSAVLLRFQGHSQRARELGLQVMQKAHVEQLPRIWNEAGLLVAFTSLQLGDSAQALQLFDVVSTRLKSERPPRPDLMVWCQIGMARHAQTLGELEQAEEHFKRALTELPVLGFPAGLMSSCFNGLGDVYRSLGDLERAQQFTMEALSYAKQYDNPILIADCYNDISELCRRQGALVDARSYVHKAIDLYESMGSDQSLRAHRNLGFLALAERDFDQAYPILNALYEHLERSHETAQLTFVMAGLLSCALARQDMQTFDELLSRLEYALTRTQQKDEEFRFAFELSLTVLDSVETTSLHVKDRLIALMEAHHTQPGPSV